jgi:hypothetical protein
MYGVHCVTLAGISYQLQAGPRRQLLGLARYVAPRADELSPVEEVSTILQLRSAHSFMAPVLSVTQLTQM